jgi:P-type Ca2+ transporter type 2C
MFHSMPASDALSELKSGRDGLAWDEVRLRLAKYGGNEFGVGKARGLLDLFVSQFKNYILVLLAAAAIVSYAIGHHEEAIGIAAVIVLNVAFGVALEYSADRSMAELKKLAKTSALVIREGKKAVVESSGLVPGDIIILEEGGKIPADCRIIEENGLEANEASLTGESMPVRKNIAPVAASTPLAERSCMVYAGTFVSHGRCFAVVCSTGRKTEFGKIEGALETVAEGATTLEKTLSDLGQVIVAVSFAIVALLFFVGAMFGNLDPKSLFIYAVAVIVAAVPEGMLTILTIILAIGVKNMAQANAVVRKLRSVETLGNITVIVTDKTGTITEGRMALVKIYDGKIRDFGELSGTEKLLSYAYLCNGAHIVEGDVVGDETDRAILIAGIAKQVNVPHFIKITPALDFSPFDSVKKSMSGKYAIGNEEIFITKGAPEQIIGECASMEGAGADWKAGCGKALSEFTGNGMRVLGVAYSKGNGKLQFLGMLALYDPIRREAHDVIDKCRGAGIRVMMATGDGLDTAKRIAATIGISGKASEWKDLEGMRGEEFRRAIAETGVIARATPESKLRVVESLTATGEIVAMTGDGINDAPALKKAHVGVVMGRTGTAVSKEVADLVLVDDNLATLERAIEYGRGIVQNIVRFLKFQITTNIALVCLSVPHVLGVSILTPIQILWINLIIDGPPAICLGLEKPTQELMLMKPAPKKRLIDGDFAAEITANGVFMACVTGIIYIYYSYDPALAASAAFTALVGMQLVNALNLRSHTRPFYSGLMENRWLLLAIIVTALMQFAILYVPIVAEYFGVVPLSLGELMLVCAAALTVAIPAEFRKLAMRGRA